MYVGCSFFLFCKNFVKKKENKEKKGCDVGRAISVR